MRYPQTRASDADRERVVAALQEHAGAGRLTLDEFSDRASAAYRASTLGDLGALTSDLPATGVPRPAPTPPTSRVHRAPLSVLAGIAVAVLLLAATLLALSGPPAAADTMHHMMGGMAQMCG